MAVRAELMIDTREQVTGDRAQPGKSNSSVSGCPLPPIYCLLSIGMSEDNSNSTRRRIGTGWFALALLAVIVGIEFAFPNGSTAQMGALAVAVAFFGSIIAWRSFGSPMAPPPPAPKRPDGLPP